MQRTLENIFSEFELKRKFGTKGKKEVAGISIGNWVKKGLPFVEISGRRFFFEDDIITFLEKFVKQEKVEANF